jgi:hypothetical protein
MDALVEGIAVAPHEHEAQLAENRSRGHIYYSQGQK